RPGYAMSEEKKRYLAEQTDFSVTYTEVTALSISSSDLRKRVAEGKSIRYLTMQRVLDYVKSHGLYR
ncbi:MAG: nicotinic acid mononucleotide adenylyltransferase, partial [Raoultibacter sp.]